MPMQPPRIRRELCGYCHHNIVEFLSTTSPHPGAPEMVQPSLGKMFGALIAGGGPWFGIVQGEGQTAALFVVCSKTCLEGLLYE